MFRDRESKRFMGSSCLCQPLPKPKTSIKQFIQVDHVANRHQDHTNKRHSRIIDLIETTNNRQSTCLPTKNITLKYPVTRNKPSPTNTSSSSNYQPFPVHENYYDEINPVDEQTTTAYDHLSRPCSTYIRQNIPCFGVNNDTKPRVKSFPAPPPPPTHPVPKISHQHYSYQQTHSLSSQKSLKKSNSSILHINDQKSERSYLFEKWSNDNSSGYNSSQDLSNQTSSSTNSSIISYCSINEEKVLADRTNQFVDSGFSTLNIDEDNYAIDNTESLSNYSNISQYSASSFNDSTSHDSDNYVQQFPSPFPRIKTCMVAQIKKVKNKIPVAQDPNVYENLQNKSPIEKSYSVNDVLFSLKKLELNHVNKQQHVNVVHTQTIAPEIISPNREYFNSNVRMCKMSTPPNVRQSIVSQRDLDDYLCDEEVQKILSPKRAEPVLLRHQPANLYKYNNSNNKKVAIWEQLV